MHVPCHDCLMICMHYLSILYICIHEKLGLILLLLFTQLCLTFCDPLDCSTPGLPVHHQLPEFTQTHVHQVGDAISSSVVPFSCPQSSPAAGSFQMSQFFASGGQSNAASASAAAVLMHI